MRFLINYRFWLPFVLLLGLEFIFELGFYEPFVKIESHSGTTIRVKKALKELGYENIDYVTIGDSRADTGIDHGAVFEASLRFGQRHISMAMPGSHFTTYKMESRFLHGNLSNLKGVLLGVSSSSMTRIFNGYAELGIIQPFRNLKDYDQVPRTIPFEIHTTESYGAVSSLFAYQQDIKDLISHPRQRIRSLLQKKRPWREVLAHGEWLDFDICSINLETPEACLASVGQITGSEPNMPQDRLDEYQRISDGCNGARYRMNLPEGDQIERVKNSWRELLHSLRFKKKPIVVLLPDNSLLEKYQFPAGVNEWALSILKPMAEQNEIILLDYSKRFAVEDECKYFLDPIHLNSLGMKTITKELLPFLKAYYQQQ
jgi:hypothetical protein